MSWWGGAGHGAIRLSPQPSLLRAAPRAIFKAEEARGRGSHGDRSPARGEGSSGFTLESLDGPEQGLEKASCGPRGRRPRGPLAELCSHLRDPNAGTKPKGKFLQYRVSRDSAGHPRKSRPLCPTPALGSRRARSGGRWPSCPGTARGAGPSPFPRQP